ncbi:DNA cytosine methyltransferase [Methylobacterium frigidaeris]|uniref:DNA (cytosine-5-)-methyltransferase n=1 Tax=Methylobacterium frigidaeris TaxID=2038277 RepID=A0AA37HG69_9HYPH|nr:DNA cytosine methyltransferase [Methylobacterium frigidaeris]PIK74593.1 DNA (cytosine-5-)-methyltransferase [Methylobacterium frigidaeris]GJD65158.1 hypothetical protein MPEAHAMD_5345 [Methylobacterium frigidaeris]
MTLRYGSVCSGIEAASVAWHPLGWRPSFFSEIEPAPRAVLAHHWPEVPLHGDFTTIEAGLYDPIDLLVGGTPCQDFSVAGLRAGLDGERGNLTLEFGRLARRLRPRWSVWENVPGVLSSHGGRDFACVLGLLAGRSVEVPAGGWQNSGVVPGYHRAYGLAWRVLDAQYVRVDGFGRAVPQRRRRVFVVGHLGDWRRAAAVLLERACLRGDPAPRRGAGQIAAASLTGSLGRRCGQPDGGDTEGHLVAALTPGNRGVSADQAAAGMVVPVAFGSNDTRGPIEAAATLTHHAGRYDFESETFVTAPIPILEATKRQGEDQSTVKVGTGIGQPGDPMFTLQAGAQHAIAFDTTQITSRENRANPEPGGPCHPLAAGAHPPAIAFDCKAGGDTGFSIGDVAGALRGEGHGGGHAAAMVGHNGGPPLSGWAVRRLTPEECEALQGFPRGHTAVPWRSGTMPDGPRYKALGNSMAVNVMRWLGRRIEMVEALFPSEFQ